MVIFSNAGIKFLNRYIYYKSPVVYFDIIPIPNTQAAGKCGRIENNIYIYIIRYIGMSYICMYIHIARCRRAEDFNIEDGRARDIWN